MSTDEGDRKCPRADRSDLLETQKAPWSICAGAERALAAGPLDLESFQVPFQRAVLPVRPAIARESEILGRTILTLRAPTPWRHQPSRPSQFAARRPPQAP